jgi:hypothetical protein
MCSELKPLRNDLSLSYRNKQISVFENNINIVTNTKLISSNSGSEAFVYKISCSGRNGSFSIAAKIHHFNNNKNVLEGLKYEKRMYKIMTLLVDSKVCSFRLRSYNMAEPTNILITETFENMVSLRDFLRKFYAYEDLEIHKQDCHNLLVQILYALEVNYRIGYRHNDLHTNNIMIKICPPETKKIIYLSRQTKNKTNIFMKQCSFIVKLFDNDRATKLKPKNHLVKSSFEQRFDPKPVLNLFPWHEPLVYTEKLDLFHIMQDIRESTLSDQLYQLLSSLNISLSKIDKRRVSRSYKKSYFDNYQLVVNKHFKKEPLAIHCKNAKKNDVACIMNHIPFTSNFPLWLDQFDSSEQALMNLTKIFKSKVEPNKKVKIVANMSNLYKMNLKLNN